MSVTNSASGFDAWDKMTVYVVVDEQANQTWRYWFGKVNAFNTATGNAWSFRAAGEIRTLQPTDSESMAPVLPITSRVQA